MKVWPKVHIVPSLSQPLIIDMYFMLDYKLIPNAITLAAEFQGSLKFALERSASGAFASVQVVAAETVTILGRYVHIVTMCSRITLGVDYAFTTHIVSHTRLRTLNDVSPVEMMTSLMMTTTNDMMITNHSQYPIRICKGDKLEQA